MLSVECEPFISMPFLSTFLVFGLYSSFRRYLFLMEGNPGHGKASEFDDIKRLFVRFD